MEYELVYYIWVSNKTSIISYLISEMGWITTEMKEAAHQTRVFKFFTIFNNCIE